jgi:hypothetical protein
MMNASQIIAVPPAKRKSRHAALQPDQGLACLLQSTAVPRSLFLMWAKGYKSDWRRINMPLLLALARQSGLMDADGRKCLPGAIHENDPHRR